MTSKPQQVALTIVSPTSTTPTNQQSYTQMTSSMAADLTSTTPTVGFVSSLPLAIQVAFLRKVLAIFALQLAFVTAVTAAFEWISGLNWVSTLDKHAGYIAIPSVGTLVLLLVLHKTRTKFPWNWICLALFSIALALVLSGLDLLLDTHIVFANICTVLMVVLVMVLLSGVRGEKSKTKLLSTFVSALAGFVGVLVVTIVLYVKYKDGFMSSQGLFVSLVFQLVMALWFAHDTKVMMRTMTPDEYMQGVVSFYADILKLVVYVVVQVLLKGRADEVIDDCCCSRAGSARRADDEV